MVLLFMQTKRKQIPRNARQKGSLQLSYLPFFSFLVISLFLFTWGCKTSTPSEPDPAHTSELRPKEVPALPPALAESQSPVAPVMQAAWLLTQQEPTEVLQSFYQGEELAEESQWTSIRQEGGNYQVLTVYNIFEGERQTEYFVLDYQVEVANLQKRFPIRDLRMIVRDDTAFISEVNLNAAEVRQKWGEREGVVVYELWGYEFQEAPTHGQLHFWSPQIGTVFQYFGQESSFELMTSKALQEGFDLAGLKAEIRKNLPD